VAGGLGDVQFLLYERGPIEVVLDAEVCFSPGASPVTFAPPVHWDAIIAYAARHAGMGDTEKSIAVRPSLEDSRAAFRDLLVKIHFENATINEGCLKALGAPVK
jgi:hypothetical protein